MTNAKPTYYPQPSETASQIEALTILVETSQTDIAPTYSEWLALGFALVEALGAGGTSYFHRLSRFNPQYDEKKAQKQYDYCLKSKGSGITIASLFYLAKQHGISYLPDGISAKGDYKTLIRRFISSQKAVEENEESEENSASLAFRRGTEGEALPTFSPLVKDYLPPIMQRVVSDSASAADADLLILGALTTFSACMPNVYGIYDKREVFANLFLFVTARASAGKGRLSLCRHLAAPIHKALRDKYKKQMEKFKAAQAAFAVSRKSGLEAQPKEPPFLTLFVPANSTATVVYQTLAENNGVGLLFETEGDTLANAFNSDLGNYSDGFRKAFHHETISYLRKKDHEFVEILRPKFSAILSGTPQQVLNLIPDTENGLFSRFVFYSMPTQLVWHDIFAASVGKTADEHFQKIGQDFYSFYKLLSKKHYIQFTLSRTQQQKFNDFFAATQIQYAQLYGDEIVASVRRLGLILFRFAMILSVLRLADPLPASFPSAIVCTDADFHTALETVKVLLVHTASVFQTLPDKPQSIRKGGRQLAAALRQRFFAALPPSFNRSAYIDVAASLNISAKTAERYINELCTSGQLIHPSQGSYQKNLVNEHHGGKPPS